MPLIETYGETALIVTLGDRPDIAINRRVHRLAAAVDRVRREANRRGVARAARSVPVIGPPVAGFATLLVPFDAERIDEEGVRALLEPLLAETSDERPMPPGSAEVLAIPVRYGGPDGPDLVEVAERHGLRPSDVVELHASAIYEVLFLGFAPGFGYLGFVPDEIATPRRSTPRPRVTAGSVGIAGNQTCVYPSATPGGWNLIGRTDIPMWNLDRPEPALLEPGRRVRFVPAG